MDPDKLSSFDLNIELNKNLYKFIVILNKIRKRIVDFDTSIEDLIKEFEPSLRETKENLKINER